MRSTASCWSPAELDGKGSLGHKTVGRIHAVLDRALGDAVRWNRLNRNIADLADGPGWKAAEVATWTDDDFRRLIEHVAADRLRAL
jgi:hypothetical protein